jgi:hypothetical protein
MSLYEKWICFNVFIVASVFRTSGFFFINFVSGDFNGILIVRLLPLVQYSLSSEAFIYTSEISKV